MNFDRSLAIAGLLLALVSLALAYYFYVKTIRTKLLAYAYSKPVSLRLPVHDVPSHYLDGENEPSRVFMLLWNKGTAPIETSDFVHPIKILPAERVLRILTHEYHGASAATVNQAEKSISIELLRPGEAIIFLIDAMDADYTPDISVLMKSSDMSVFLPSAPTEARDTIAMAAAVATFLLLTGIMMWSAVVFDLPGPAPVPVSILFPVVISAFVVVGLTYWVHKLVRQSLLWLTPDLPSKFFSLQTTCSEMNRSWAWLRQQSDWLMGMG